MVQAGLEELPHLVREFVPLVRLREVQVSMAEAVPQAPPFLQVVPMVVQPFLELSVQMAEWRVLYLLSVVLLVALVFQGVQVLGVLVVQVFLGEQILVVLVFRGALTLAARVVQGALFLGGLEVHLSLELAVLWLDLDRLVVPKIPGVLEVLEAVQTLFF